MTIFDWAIIIIAVLLAIRGWRRGFLREVIDWSLLLFGSPVATTTVSASSRTI